MHYFCKGGEVMLYIDEDDNIKLTRGDTAVIDIEITDASGNPYIMQPLDELIFTVRKIYDAGSVVIEKTLQTPVITLVTNDTKDLTFGLYRYDIYLYNSSTHIIDTFIAEKIFEVAEEVHEFEQFNRSRNAARKAKK